ncbi:MAG: bacillithiol system redox-active protein YtxJ [Balneolaceae bacterium]
MSFFSGFKKVITAGRVDESIWNIPETENEVDEIFERSSDRPQLIYKHSNSCSICWFSKSEIESAFESISKYADCHFVNVVRSRPLSNYIASRSKIIHQSPQVLIIHNGIAVWNTSHGSIRAYAVLEQLRALQ